MRNFAQRCETSNADIKKSANDGNLPADTISGLSLESCFNLDRLPRGDVLIVRATTPAAASAV